MQRISIKVSKNGFTVKPTSREYKMSLRYRKQEFKIDNTTRTINITQGGKRGLPGKGIPSGGLPGQVLIKMGTEDYDTQWGNVAGTDKNYIQAFTVSTEVAVEHNLSKFPAVTIHDTAGDEVEGEVIHINVNNLVVRFSAPFSGLITCN